MSRNIRTLLSLLEMLLPTLKAACMHYVSFVCLIMIMNSSSGKAVSAHGLACHRSGPRHQRHAAALGKRQTVIIIIIMKAKIIVTLYIKNVTGALYTVNYNENMLSMSVSVGCVALM